MLTFPFQAAPKSVRFFLDIPLGLPALGSEGAPACLGRLTLASSSTSCNVAQVGATRNQCVAAPAGGRAGRRADVCVRVNVRGERRHVRGSSEAGRLKSGEGEVGGGRLGKGSRTSFDAGSLQRRQQPPPTPRRKRQRKGFSLSPKGGPRSSSSFPLDPPSSRHANAFVDQQSAFAPSPGSQTPPPRY